MLMSRPIINRLNDLQEENGCKTVNNDNSMRDAGRTLNYYESTAPVPLIIMNRLHKSSQYI